MPQRARIFLVPAEHIRDGRVYFPSEEQHHLLDVLRLGSGAQVRVFDGSGNIYDCRLNIAKKKVWGEIVSRHSGGAVALIPVTLGAAVLKSERFDWLVEKATELGVCRIVPILTERSLKTARPERWRRVAQAACKQSGNPYLPVIEGLTPLQHFLEQCDSAIRFCFDERGDRLPPAAATRRGSSALLIGPEGGWQAHERDAAVRAGFEVVSLPGTTLRAETAAIVAVALLRGQYDWGEQR